MIFLKTPPPIGLYGAILAGRGDKPLKKISFIIYAQRRAVILKSPWEFCKFCSKKRNKFGGAITGGNVVEVFPFSPNLFGLIVFGGKKIGLAGSGNLFFLGPPKKIRALGDKGGGAKVFFFTNFAIFGQKKRGGALFFLGNFKKRKKTPKKPH